MNVLSTRHGMLKENLAFDLMEMYHGLVCYGRLIRDPRCIVAWKFNEIKEWQIIPHPEIQNLDKVTEDDLIYDIIRIANGLNRENDEHMPDLNYKLVYNDHDKTWTHATKPTLMCLLRADLQCLMNWLGTRVPTDMFESEDALVQAKKFHDLGWQLTFFWQPLVESRFLNVADILFTIKKLLSRVTAESPDFWTHNMILPVLNFPLYWIDEGIVDYGPEHWEKHLLDLCNSFPIIADQLQLPLKNSICWRGGYVYEHPCNLEDLVDDIKTFVQAVVDHHGWTFKARNHGMSVETVADYQSLIDNGY